MLKKYTNIFDAKQDSIDRLIRIANVGIWFRGPIDIAIGIADFKKRKCETLYGHDIVLIGKCSQSWVIYSRINGNFRESGYGGFVRMVITLSNDKLRSDLFIRVDMLVLSMMIIAILITMFGTNLYGILLVILLSLAFVAVMIRRDVDFYTKASKAMNVQ
jgi:hypothetical protein